jgi:hypothetical protein
VRRHRREGRQGGIEQGGLAVRACVCVCVCYFACRHVKPGVVSEVLLSLWNMPQQHALAANQTRLLRSCACRTH